MGELASENENPYDLVQDHLVRVNTVRVDFSRLKRIPCTSQLQEFIGLNLEVQPGDVLRMQWSRQERCLFMKMRDQRTAERLVGMHSGRHRFPAGNFRPRIALSLEDGTTDVMLHDLSEMVDEDEVQTIMGQYGVVMGITKGRWPCDGRFAGVDNGKLLVRMVIRRPIPRIVYIAGEETFVTYDGQPLARSSLLAGLTIVFQRIFGFRRN